MCEFPGNVWYSTATEVCAQVCARLAATRIYCNCAQSRTQSYVAVLYMEINKRAPHGDWENRELGVAGGKPQKGRMRRRE